MGETIRCPFHAWQYDGDGAVVEIPYCKKIPPRARVRSWDVVERNEMILVWHHAEGKPPSWEVPALAEFSDPEWTEPRHFELEVAVHMQDMAENNCDPIHFQYVHNGITDSETEISFGDDGRFMRMLNRGEQETPFGTFMMELERDAWGLGLVSVRMRNAPGAGLLMMSSTTPVDTGHTISRWAFTVTQNMADIAGEEFIKGMTTGVQQDMQIWKNKIHRADPVFCEADTYLSEFRRWARQFYSSPA